MTLLQEEQEKPQSKAGPTRHAKIMRGIVTPIFGLLAIACIVLGVLNATIWKPSAQVTASASVTGSQYVVTDPNVLQLVDDRVTISAKSRDKSANVCIAIGSARDIAGWIAGSKYTRVTGLSDWSTLSTLKATAQGMPVPLICSSRVLIRIMPRIPLRLSITAIAREVRSRLIGTVVRC